PIRFPSSAVISGSTMLRRNCALANVRFTPESRHPTAQVGCPLSTKSRQFETFEYNVLGKVLSWPSIAMKLRGRKLLHLAAGAAAALAIPRFALALDCPTRPVPPVRLGQHSVCTQDKDNLRIQKYPDMDVCRGKQAPPRKTMSANRI